MRYFYELMPTVKTLIDREGELLKRDVDGKTFNEYEALLRDVTSAGADVPEGHDRDTLSDLMYRLASTMVVDFDQSLNAPVLKPYSLTPVPPAADASPEPPLEPDPMAQRRPQPVAPVRGDGHRRPPPPKPANVTRAPTPSESAQSKAFELVNWAAMARAWKKAVDNKDENQAAGLLVSGNALTRIKGFAEDDRNIDAFVRASEKAENEQRRRQKRTNVLRIVLSCMLVAAVVVGIALYREQQDLINAAATDAAEKADLLDAVQGVKDGNAEKLIAFLQSKTDPEQRDVLRRLTVLVDPNPSGDDKATVLASPTTDALQSASSVSTTSVPTAPSTAEPEAPRVSASDTTMRRLAGLWDANDTCSGAMWIGNSDRSLIKDVAVLSELNVGQVIVAYDGMINIRDGLPTPATDEGEDYTLKPAIGAVPNGALIQLDSKPVAYPGDNVERYWAEVTVPRQFCTKVFVNYTGGSSGKSFQNVVDILAKRGGFIVPRPTGTAKAKDMSEIRYYSDADESFVNQIEEALTSAGMTDKVIRWQLPPSSNQVKGVIEVWLDLS